MKKVDYINRELSWLKFNKRVLSIATDKKTPLFEKLKFLGITASNLDEFFMVRVASLKDLVHIDYKKKDIAGLRPQDQLNALYPELHKFVKDQYKVYDSLKKPLKNAGVELTWITEMTQDELAFIDKYFDNEIHHKITPIYLNKKVPFPLIQQKTVNILFELGGKQPTYVTVQVPESLPRIVVLPFNTKKKRIILIEEIIKYSMEKFLPDADMIVAWGTYRIKRNSTVRPVLESGDPLIKFEAKLKNRRWGEVVQLETNIDGKTPLKVLKKGLGIKDEDVYVINTGRPVDLTFLQEIYDLSGFGKYKEKEFKAKPSKLPKNGKFFKLLDKEDIVVYHPYDTFDIVVKFLQYAANDPRTTHIYQTLYRVTDNSPIVKALITAAKKGKEVSVVIEIRARFDEVNNIRWAKKLMNSGVHVYYGFENFKTHSKMSSVIRVDKTGEKHVYTHLGTGNYNDKTAKLYTDMGMFTSDILIGYETLKVFNILINHKIKRDFKYLLVAPYNMKDKIISMINNEIKKKENGKDARIIMKCNSLSDQDIIDALYRASIAGVKVDLIVRGICCLIPGMKYSKNIKVISIVGTFLEHARVYYFLNGGDERIFLGSADMMPRNLEHRVEVIFPIKNEKLAKNLKSILTLQLKDNVNARVMNSNGNYKKIKSSNKKIDSQKILIKK